MASDPARAGSYFIETWGCQMNVHDSEKLAGALEKDGYSAAAAPERADVILLNTCSIRERAAEKVFSELGRLKQIKNRRPEVLIGVCGCVAQQEGAGLFARAPHVDFVIGPRATGSLPKIVARLRAGDAAARHSMDLEIRSDSVDFPFSDIQRRGDKPGQAFVTVNEGCNHRCTYCVVPRTRGREICRSMASVMDEVEGLARRGRVEIEFLGQTVNAYRDGAGNTLADILLAAAEIEGISRIRFTTSHPAQMTDELMDAMAQGRPQVCPYLHLPVQSGSSAVLRDMRRGYDRDDYLGKIAGLLARMPEMRFGTDVIVGFPTETEEDFERTLSLLDEVRFDTVYSFAYSPRPGTKAQEMGDPLPVEAKMERLRTLQERQKALQELRNSELVGREVEVLVEGRSKLDSSEWTGRTPENRIVNFAGATAAGRLERINIVASSAFSLRGELVVCCS